MLLLELLPRTGPANSRGQGVGVHTHPGPHSRSQGRAGGLEGGAPSILVGDMNCQQRAWRQYSFVEAKNQVKSFQSLNYYL